MLSGDLFACGLVIKKEDLAKLSGVSCSSIVAKHSHTLYINELCKL